MTFAFTIREIFPLPPTAPLPSKGYQVVLRQPQGQYCELEAQDTASRIKIQPRGSNPSLEAQIPALKL